MARLLYDCLFRRRTRLLFRLFHRVALQPVARAAPSRGWSCLIGLSQAKPPDAGRAPPRAGPAIEFVGVHKWYGEFHVVRNIRLAVDPGGAGGRLRAIGL